MQKYITLKVEATGDRSATENTPLMLCHRIKAVLNEYGLNARVSAEEQDAKAPEGGK